MNRYILLIFAGIGFLTLFDIVILHKEPTSEEIFKNLRTSIVVSLLILFLKKDEWKENFIKAEKEAKE